MLTTIIIWSLMLNFDQDGIDAYRWKNRIIIQFVEEYSVYDKKYWRKYEQPLKERDIVVFIVSLKKNQMLSLYDELESVEAKPLIEQFDKEKVSKMILIGKDGGQKWEGSLHENPQFIFDKIDTMPMRQSELNQRN
ncbi:MAG: DUF4174 domain-containing protein [Cyclobacteriaceae bacterium]